MKCLQERTGARYVAGIQYAYSYPCGYCLHCRINKRNQWAGRILMESVCNPFSYFVTLTYDDLHPLTDTIRLPNKLLTLDKSHFQKFIKRFRRYSPGDRQVRYYACGEYGEKAKRAHWHAVIFTDIEPNQFEQVLKKAWTLKNQQIGFVTCSLLNEERAQYVAQYTTKKLTSGVTYLDGRASELALMSKKPSIGHDMILQLAETYAKYNGLFLKNYPGCDDMTRMKLLTSIGKGVFHLNGRTWPLDRYAKQLIIKTIEQRYNIKFDNIPIIDEKLRDTVYHPDIDIARVSIGGEAKKAIKSAKNARRFAARKARQSRSNF